MKGANFLACLKAPSLRPHNSVCLHGVGIRVSNICALAPPFVCLCVHTCSASMVYINDF